jgi:hypothetical protein
LKAIAAERAEIMQTAIHNITDQRGQPLAARTAPVNAKGNAKIECSHLIVSNVSRALRKIFPIPLSYSTANPSQRSRIGKLPLSIRTLHLLLD